MAIAKELGIEGNLVTMKSTAIIELIRTQNNKGDDLID
jgi:hypothetical protein